MTVLDGLPTDAETVIIVVHGVGDPSVVNILDEAERGKIGLDNENAKVERETVHNFPHPGGERSDTQVLIVNSSSYLHVVIPVVWSRLHFRSATAASPVYIGGIMNRIAAAIGFLLMAWSDLVLCIFKARKRVWAIILGLTSLFWLIVISFVFMGLLVLLVQTFNIKEYIEHRGYRVLSQVVLELITIGVLPFILRKFLPLLDLIGDVVHYVGRKKARKEIESDLRKIILETADRCPNAQILLVGHSLGSVLVSQVASTLTLDDIAGDRILLLTLCCPLRLISKVFGTVKPPNDLIVDFKRNRVVHFWANLWRDRDFIGRELDMRKIDCFGEKSLGDGSHSGMWGDDRLWHEMQVLLTAIHTQTLGTIKSTWATYMSNVAANEDIFPLTLTLMLRRWCSLAGMIGAAAMVAIGIVQQYYKDQMLVCLFFLLFEIITFGIFTLSHQPREPIDRRYLGDLRLAKSNGNSFVPLAWFALFLLMAAIAFQTLHGLEVD